MKFTDEKELCINSILKFNIDNCIIRKDKDMVLTYTSGEPILYLNSDEAMLDASIVDVDDKGTQYITIIPFIDIITNHQDIYGNIKDMEEILVI